MHRITTYPGMAHMENRDAGTEAANAELDEALARAIRQLITEVGETDAAAGAAV
jgi:hypothetical protein